MAQRKRRYKEFELRICLGLIVAAILFIAFLFASGTGNAWLKAIYAIVAIGICGGCLWLLYKTKELLRRRSFWMSVAAAAIIVCIIASLILNYPSPNIYG